ncbi:hypothetical protein K0M31_010428 [Melipona bicolor]|uniref:Uncharacterized protein n=1 Tax=Melipona bicolor TaxID=60889 RepID=A0AA40FM09_9HYME|nr:hypothetical protein K0M31_010428 [Melipona bicolor]
MANVGSSSFGSQSRVCKAPAPSQLKWKRENLRKRRSKFTAGKFALELRTAGNPSATAVSLCVRVSPGTSPPVRGNKSPPEAGIVRKRRSAAVVERLCLPLHQVNHPRRDARQAGLRPTSGTRGAPCDTGQTSLPSVRIVERVQTRRVVGLPR